MWFSRKEGSSGFSSRSTAEEVTQGIDGTGLTAIVTGASSGIGTEIARVLALRGVHVVMAVRNVESGGKVKQTILEEIPSAKIEVMELDLSSMASVRKFASEYNASGLPLSLLINNAGLMAPPFTLSQDGIELQFATNHLGHFLLTNLLLQNMKRTANDSHREGRIVNVSSEAHRSVYPEGIRFDKLNVQSSYNSLHAYGQSKLANILHTSELARLLKEEDANITANSVHPGIIYTNLMRHNKIVEGIGRWFGMFFLKNVRKGAAPPCYVALHPHVQGVSGKYFKEFEICEPSALAQDADLAKKLWEFSMELTDTK